MSTTRRFLLVESCEHGNLRTHWAGELHCKATSRTLNASDLSAFAVAALIAEGGEIIWWCDVRRVENKDAYRRTVTCHVNTEGRHDACGPRLVYGPIPIESAEA